MKRRFLFLVLAAVAIVAWSSSNKAKDPKPESTAIVNTEAREITWDDLIPEGYDPNSVIYKYQSQLDELDDYDPKAMEIFSKIQEELDNAPVNPEIDGNTIRIPGFIAPLDNVNGKITDFLLVPYFGACIHVPPPPINQTVMVSAKDGHEIRSEDSYLPIWIEGTMNTSEFRTDIGVAGYNVSDAKITPYTLEDAQ